MIPPMSIKLDPDNEQHLRVILETGKVVIDTRHISKSCCCWGVKGVFDLMEPENLDGIVDVLDYDLDIRIRCKEDKRSAHYISYSQCSLPSSILTTGERILWNYMD